MTLSNMKASLHAKPFEKEVDLWECTLSHILEVIEMILQVQRQWMYLEVCLYNTLNVYIVYLMSVQYTSSVQYIIYIINLVSVQYTSCLYNTLSVWFLHLHSDLTLPGVVMQYIAPAAR